MKTKEMSVGISFTKNLGNYESLRVEAHETVELEPGEDRDECFARLYAAVQENLAKELDGALRRAGRDGLVMMGG